MRIERGERLQGLRQHGESSRMTLAVAWLLLRVGKPLFDRDHLPLRHAHHAADKSGTLFLKAAWLSRLAFGNRRQRPLAVDLRSALKPVIQLRFTESGLRFDVADRGARQIHLPRPQRGFRNVGHVRCPYQANACSIPLIPAKARIQQ